MCACVCASGVCIKSCVCVAAGGMCISDQGGCVVPLGWLACG